MTTSTKKSERLLFLTYFWSAIAICVTDIYKKSERLLFLTYFWSAIASL
ncbi:MAG: hypothetical protein V7L22_31980 [Nostoc sp.]